MTPKRFYLCTVAVMAVGIMVATRASADDAARDWSQSMGFSTPSQTANAFNAALALRNLQQGGSGIAGGTTYNCKAVGSCTQGAVTQWNGVSVNTVTGSSGITIDNDIDADSDQDAAVDIN